MEWKAQRLQRELRDRRDPAGAFGAEEARRPPRGKRSAWNGKKLDPFTHKLKRTADNFHFR
ncbi:Ribose 5-phosphate isomerase B [Bacillus badius]|uniref:Ribose 5-phosphate isomerase B n=1 Tax=Bacillus badius TaxID=1455 RepID=A0ABR5AY11_BACBA|nr:Ribose 5-phosphate isomerase B [Bacillus badius]KIL79617.1 Ribose 5-phosphate isomerase B [Bacillus badius]